MPPRGEVLRIEYDGRTNEHIVRSAPAWVEEALRVPRLTPRFRRGVLELCRGCVELYARDRDDPSAIRIRAGALEVLFGLGARAEDDGPADPPPSDPEDGFAETDFPPLPSSARKLGEFSRLLAWVENLSNQGRIRYRGSYDFVFRIPSAWPGLRILFVAPTEEEAERAREQLRACAADLGAGRLPLPDPDELAASGMAVVTTPFGGEAAGTNLLFDHDLVIYLDADLAIPEFHANAHNRELADILFRSHGCAKIIGLVDESCERENPLDDALRVATFGHQFLNWGGASAPPPASAGDRRPSRIAFPGIYRSTSATRRRRAGANPQGCGRGRGDEGGWARRVGKPPKPLTLNSVITLESLLEAFRSLRDEKGQAPGPDGIGPGRIGIAEAIVLCESLFKQLRCNHWRPGPTREVPIPKSDGGTRTIRVANVADRIVSTCVADGISEFAEHSQYDCSHGWRRGRSHSGMLHALAGAYRETGAGFLVINDVRRCFDEVSPHAVQAAVKRLFKDDRGLRCLILKCVRGTRRSGEPGIDQGSALSPIVMNLVLGGLVDESMMEELGAISFLRYADNLVALAEDEAEARRVQEAWGGLLARGGMELKGGPGLGIFNLATGEEAQFLGARVRAEGGELRFALTDGSLEGLREKLECILDEFENRAGDLLPVVLETLGSWIAAYEPVISPGRDRDEARDRVMDMLIAVGLSGKIHEAARSLVCSKFQDRPDQAEAGQIQGPGAAPSLELGSHFFRGRIPDEPLKIGRDAAMHSRRNPPGLVVIGGEIAADPARDPLLLPACSEGEEPAPTGGRLPVGGIEGGRGAVRMEGPAAFENRATTRHRRNVWAVRPGRWSAGASIRPGWIGGEDPMVVRSGHSRARAVDPIAPGRMDRRALPLGRPPPHARPARPPVGCGRPDGLRTTEADWGGAECGHGIEAIDRGGRGRREDSRAGPHRAAFCPGYALRTAWPPRAAWGSSRDDPDCGSPSGRPGGVGGSRASPLAEEAQGVCAGDDLAGCRSRNRPPAPRLFRDGPSPPQSAAARWIRATPSRPRSHVIRARPGIGSNAAFPGSPGSGDV